MNEIATSDARAPGLGRPIAYGAEGAEKRLTAIRRIADLGGKRLLDVGCGNGAYTERLATAFEETVAIDVSGAHLDDFRRRSTDISVRELAVENVDYPGGHFDAVVMIEVIEHLVDVGAALTQIRRVIKTGGTLVVTAPNRLFPLETHLVVLGKRRVRGRYIPFLPWIPVLHDRLADARTYTSSSLRDVVEAHGFTLSGVTYAMPPFDNWRFGRRFLKPITDMCEASPLRRFGVSIVATFTASSS